MESNQLKKAMAPQFNPYYSNYYNPYHPYQYYQSGYPPTAFNPYYSSNAFYQHPVQQVQNYPLYSSPQPCTCQCSQVPIKKSIHLQKQNANKNKKIIKQQVSIMKVNGQNENRNVYSNLLRLFFKNILEVEFYDKLVGRIIKNFQLSLTVEDFINWVIELRVNFKNYLKLKTIKKIFEKRGTQEHKLILRIVLKEYLNKYSINHSLTSKRIEGHSSKLHLEGARQLFHLLISKREEKS